MDERRGDQTGRHAYIIALGSNMRVPGIGGPHAVLTEAVKALAGHDLEVEALSHIRPSRPLGPSQRTYANAAILVRASHGPVEMLAALQSVERQFGRSRRGARWRARPLDLDIVLWSGGVWLSPHLVIPHPLFRERDFVTRPSAEVAPQWRDPITGLTLRQIAQRVS